MGVMFKLSLKKYRTCIVGSSRQVSSPMDRKHHDDGYAGNPETSVRGKRPTGNSDLGPLSQIYSTWSSPNLPSLPKGQYTKQAQSRTSPQNRIPKVWRSTSWCASLAGEGEDRLGELSSLPARRKLPRGQHGSAKRI